MKITPQNFINRNQRRVLTDDGKAGFDNKEGFGSSTQKMQSKVAQVIFENCERLDNIQLDEIIDWVKLYKANS